MQYMIPFCFLCLIVLQQTLNVASIALLKQNLDNEVRRPNIARRLRAPLMGRSITTTLKESNGMNSRDENELIYPNKRRYGLALIGPRRWMNLGRKGPLLG